MRSRAPQIAAAFVLLICFVCPMVEMFDTWDDTMQTGGDTEYALVLLALCVGIAYSLIRFAFARSNQRDFFSHRRPVPGIRYGASSTPCCVLLVFEALSPPGLSLRI
jgi:hypothetical protein